MPQEKPLAVIILFICLKLKKKKISRNIWLTKCTETNTDIFFKEDCKQVNMINLNEQSSSLGEDDQEKEIELLFKNPPKIFKEM